MSPTKAALRLAEKLGVAEPSGEAAYDELYRAVLDEPASERTIRKVDKGAFARRWEASRVAY